MYLSKDYEGLQATGSFSPDDAFYLIVQLTEAADTTQVKAVWSAQQVQDYPPGTVIGETELISRDGIYHFELMNEGPWPIGRYKVDLFLNNTLKQTLEFNVK